MRGARDVVIVAACRTPIGAFGGALKTVRGPVLASLVMKDALKRSGVDPAAVQDVLYGCCLEDYEALNIARISALLAGIPDKVPAATFNRVCLSAMESVHSAVMQIQSGTNDVVMAGGVESMSNAYYYLPDARWGQRMQDGKCCDSIVHALNVGSEFLPYPINGPNAAMRGKKYIMGMTAEFLAEKYNITRVQQDEVALRSHNLTQKATEQGKFKDEIVPVPVKVKKAVKMVDKDEHFRKDLTMEQLAALPPAFFPKGTVTAGNSSGINDGAAAVLLMSRAKADAMGIKPLATITGLGRGGCAPELMGESPVPAVRDLLAKTSRKISEYERIECNEAFAAQYLSCEQQLGWNRDVTNVNGSGIGLGHPVGCTGARIIVSLLYELIHSQKKLGMATMCGGGGVSLATEITLC